jgi:hypothetical protein
MSDPAPFTVRREDPRFDLRLRLVLERDDPFTGKLHSEDTVTENVSLGGALVPTQLGVLKGETVRLRLVDEALELRATVVGLRAGRDGALLRLKFESLSRDAMAAVLRRQGVDPHVADVRFAP